MTRTGLPIVATLAAAALVLPAASAEAAASTAGAKHAAVAFQHALGQGQDAKACALVSDDGVEVMAAAVSKPASRGCAKLLPSYRAFAKKVLGSGYGKLKTAKVTDAQADGATVLVITNAAATDVRKHHGTWQVDAPLRFG